jgi:hypothetical protein
VKKHILLASFLFLFLFQNCSSNDCNKLCFTPPNPFQFEFVDATTKENLFTNNTFNKSDITITNLVNNSNVTFSFIDENNYNILAINSIGWETEIVTCSIEIDGKQVAILYVTATSARSMTSPAVSNQKVLLSQFYIIVVPP